MGILASYLTLATRLLHRLGLCAQLGTLLGLVVGGIMDLFRAGDEHWVLSTSEVFAFGLILALVAWGIILVVLCVWEHYTFRSAAVPTLLIALFTSVLTVFLTNLGKFPSLGWFLGAIVGVICGEVFCRICSLFTKTQLEKTDAMHR